MPVRNISAHYETLVNTGSIPRVVDDIFTQAFNGEPWHWTISLIMVMYLTYLATDDFFIASLPATIVLIVMVSFDKIAGGAILPMAFVFILAFSSMMYGIFKSKRR